MKSPFARGLLLLCALLLAACAGTPDIHRLSNAEYGETITLEQGQMLEIQVYSNPSTGYAWTLDDELSGALVEIESRHESLGRSGDVGAGEILTLRLRAEQPGRELLRYSYRRPSDTETAPADRIDVVVIVE